MKKAHTILYADNDTHTKRILSNYFDKYFDEVLQANNANEALKIYKNKSPNMILLDIDIPNSNGIEIIKKLRKNENKTPIIVLTNNTKTDCLIEAIKLNLVDYLLKPVDSDKFQDAIKRAMKLSLLNKNEIEEIEVIQITRTSYWDIKKRLFFYKGKILELTKNERLLFELLIIKKNEIVQPGEISEHVWNIKNDNLNDASIRNLVKRLRKKLPIDIVRSIYGSGYIMSF